MFGLIVPKLNDVQFGIQVLGFKMPWAWNKYIENRAKNDAKYWEYAHKENREYFKKFLRRAKLHRKHISLLK